MLITTLTKSNSLSMRMFALAFAGLPSPVNIDDAGVVGSKKSQTKSKPGGIGGEVATMFMNDDQLLAGKTMLRQLQFEIIILFAQDASHAITIICDCDAWNRCSYARRACS